MDRLIDPLAIGLDVVKFLGSGAEVLVRCPYHTDSHPSATFNTKLGLFHCFSCGTSKNSFQLAHDLDGEIQTFEDVLVFTTENGIDFKLGEDDDSWEMWLRYRPARADNEYLDSRGVAAFLYAQYDIREFPGGVIFPLKDAAGRVIGVQTRWLSGDRRYILFGKRPPVFPMNKLPKYLARAAKGSAPLFIVEGIFGVLRLEGFYANAVATMGASAMREVVGLVGTTPNVFGMFDPDDAGRIASAKLAMCGIPCYREGIEADELENATLLYESSGFSIDPEEFANKTKNPKSAIAQAIRFREAVYGRDREKT